MFRAINAFVALIIVVPLVLIALAWGATFAYAFSVEVWPRIWPWIAASATAALAAFSAFCYFATRKL